MKIFDLLRMSISNLWKRKLRTVLTVLGVVIGITSIVDTDLFRRILFVQQRPG